MKIVTDTLDWDGPSATNPSDRVPGLRSLSHADRDRPDVLIVRVGADHSDATLRTVGRAVSTAVGALLIQDAEGALERDVYDRGRADGPTRFSASNGPAPMHTDGMHVPGQHVPEYFSLTCIHQADSGGELSFLHLRDLLTELDERAIELLAREYWFHTKGVDPNGRDHVLRRVLEPGPDGELEIQYAREYIDLGHGLPDAPDLTDEQLGVLARVDEVLADTALWRNRRLERGDVALIDNRRVLHSRTAFVDDPDRPARRMMRLWIERGNRQAPS